MRSNNEEEISGNTPQISIVLPCLNEEQAIGFCLDQIKSVIKKNNLSAEILVVDNGSADNSFKIAEEKQVRLVYEKEKGYGAACLKGLKAAEGKFIFLADCDGSYDFSEILDFIEELKKGSDFVIGNRFKGRIENGAMPWPHQWIGNPILSGIFRLFFKAKIHDVHCGMKALTQDALKMLNLRTKGMEFASEIAMLVGKNRLKIKELPINYHKRRGRSKLRTLADGWRHLRFMLLYSPLFLFFIPGLILFLSGAASMLWMYLEPPKILGIQFYYHPMFVSVLLIIIGYQLIIFSLFSKTYAITYLGDKPVFEKLYKYITIETASIAGILIGISGMIIYAGIFFKWLSSGLGQLEEIRNSILALTLIIIGIQTIFSSFMLSFLGIKGEPFE
ncbi:MAG: glycosyltransferase [Candidatus Omnitrophota bacterium]|jgi:glycosyltransferase involved in cell wall biosynthesis